MTRNAMGSLVAFGLGFAVTIVALPAKAVQQYTATPLTTLGARNGTAAGINASSQITGAALFPTQSGTVFHAFLYSNGTLFDLGTFGGSRSSGQGINDSGQVAGTADFAGDTDGHAFLYSGGMMYDLGTLGGVGGGGRPSTPIFGSMGFAINASGQVTGSALTTDNHIHAFIYSGGGMRDLGTLVGGSYSAGLSINASGDVTGQALTPLGGSHAFLYTNGQMQDLGTLGGTTSTGNGINDSRQVTGVAATTGDAATHAFLYSSGIMRDLGTLGGSSSQGNAIDNTGQIVGSALTGDAKTRAFLYSEGTMYDLNTLVMSGLANATLVGALSISSHGQILATGCIQENCQPYLLDPIPPPAGGGGGGCGITTRYGPPDPTLPLLLATALIAVLARSERRGPGQTFSSGQ